MDRGYELKQEVDSCLSEIKLTEQMKRKERVEGETFRLKEA